MKKVFEKIEYGVAMGCFGFVAMLFIASAVAGGANVFMGQRTGEEWLQVAACFIIIALGYSVSSLIYELERFAISLRVLFHMTIGGVVFLLTSYFAGWIGEDFGAVMMYILIALGITAAFWGVLVLGLKMQADKINKKIDSK